MNVRRLFIMLRRSLEAGTQWCVFEPNTRTTWRLLADSVDLFLGQLHAKGMFVGGNPAEAFYVKCDEETNSDETRDAGMLVCDVGVAPVSPAEFIVIRVVQKLDTEAYGSIA